MPDGAGAGLFGGAAALDLVTLMLYGVFLYTQTIRHSDYFVKGGAGAAAETSSLSSRMLALSIALLLVSLLAVVLLAKKCSWSTS